MRYSGYNCEFCNKPFDEADDIVVCPVCGSPHHRSCWFDNGRCAKYELHDEGFQWSFGEPEKKDEPAEVRSRVLIGENVITFKNGEKTVECRNCGAINYGNDAFCMKCHLPLNGDTGSEKNDEARRNSAAFECQRLFGGLSPETPVSGIPAFEYSDYIGGKNPGIIIRKFATMERYGKKIIPSFWALVFGPIWLLYKKMYKLGAIFFAILAFVYAVQGVLSVTQPNIELNKRIISLSESVMSGELTMDDYMASLNAVQKKFNEHDPEFGFTDADILKENISLAISYIPYAVHFICMLFGVSWYKKKVQSDILKIREISSSMEEYRSNLALRGGTSVFSAICGVFLRMLISVISSLPLFVALFKG